MDLRQIEELMKNSKNGVMEKKEILISNLNNNNDTNHQNIDTASALQLFLDHIPINSIPGINNSSSILELKTGDCLRDAIELLYEKNVSGAPIADVLDSAITTTVQRFEDPYIGFVDFANMLLWTLEECEKARVHAKDDVVHDKHPNGIFSMLDQYPHIAQTKISELAKSFLWDPFFPVNIDDTLFHVLLLLSKHPLQVVPVVDGSKFKVIGFVTQNAVIHLLLQSSGLEWFDTIANKTLSEFRFVNEERPVYICGDQSIAEALHIMLENRIGSVAVVQRETKTLIGCMRSSDLHLLLDNVDVFNSRKSMTVEQFIHLDTTTKDTDPTIDPNLGALLSAGTLNLRNNFLPRMDSLVTNKKTDTLKQAMKNLADTKSNFSFLVDEQQRLRGYLTSREIIVQFAPPAMDSRITGGGFFESALELSGCHMENGTMICDN